MGIIWIVIACISLIVGSFLNVVIYRYPRMLKIQWAQECETCHPEPATSITRFNLCFPSSHCPSCQNPIPMYCNIPLLSFLFLRGKCHACRTPIPARYFLVELMTLALSLVVFSRYGWTLQTAFLLLLTWTLIALCFIDLEHFILPDAMTLSLLWLGLIASLNNIFISPKTAIIGAIAGYLFLWLIAKGFYLVKKIDGLGYGDCKLLAMFGAWVGATSLLPIILCASIAALIGFGYLLLTKKITMASPIPFGPFIAIAGWITVIFQSQMTSLFLGYFS